MARNWRLRLFLIILGILTLITGLRGDFLAFMTALLVLTAVGAAYLWNRYAFRKLKIERGLSCTKAEWGQPLTYSITLTNRKVLPVFGLRVNDIIQTGLQFRDPQYVQMSRAIGSGVFKDFFNVSWYEKRRRTYEIEPVKRGRFYLGPGSAVAPDLFGLFMNKWDDCFPQQELIVFPRILPVKGIEALDTFLFGARQKEGWIYTDPLNKVGTRSYQSTDSARQINWKASARHVQLQVDVEKPSFDREVYILLQHPVQVQWWASPVSNNLEVAIMTAASLIGRYTRAGFKISLFTNLASSFQSRHGIMQGGLDPKRGQRQALLTTLAVVQSFSLEPIPKALKAARRRLRPGSSVILVTTASEIEEELEREIKELRARSNLAVIRVNPERPGDKLPVGREFYMDGSELWDAIQSLEIS